jgi:hypothetical protein
MFASRNSFLAGGGTKPNAPTVGTATATGTTTATVSYTAPAFDGGSPITSYTATSSPSGITGTISQAGSGTITVSGLSAGTTYTFTVTATNIIGTSDASSASNSIITVPVIGQSFQGGYYGGSISTTANGVATHYLIVSPKSSGEAFYAFANGSYSDPFSNIDGPTNSSTMNNSNHPAAQFCEGLTIGGYSDWYLPAWDEMDTLYYFLKPTTTNNNTSSGYNSYAVSPEPINTLYTTTDPSRTSVAAFQNGGAEYFNSDYYWTSTQDGSSFSSNAKTKNFSNGDTTFVLAKTTSLYVRAIRRVAV